MAKEDIIGVVHEISSLLSSENRDFLLRNNGDRVQISSLVGKTVGFYFSASWCGPCRDFTPTLVQVYEELSSKGDFEIVFISGDRDEESFSSYFSEMPWLAIPFSEEGTRKYLKELFNVREVPNLVFFDSNGKATTGEGVSVIKEYGAEAYPFTTERIDFCKEAEENAKKNQTLSSILISNAPVYLISSEGNKVPVAELEGKMVGLFFTLRAHPLCADFTPKLEEMYKNLKAKRENFEVVLISIDRDEALFKKDLETMPWLALPFKDPLGEKLLRYFELKQLPSLVIIGEDGKTLNSNVAEVVEEHGAEAYPFSSEKLVELAEITKARLEAQNLETFLVHGENDFVIEKSGSKIPVSELVGKTILLYFSAQWCPPCRDFTPKLIEAYHEIKAKDSAFEIIFFSSDRNQASFDAYYSCMPWLALPFGDPRKTILQRKLRVQGLPSALVIGPNGKIVTKEARKLLIFHGPEAYPFTEDHLKQLEEKLDKIAMGWPEKLNHDLHPQHGLIRTKFGQYGCDACREVTLGWCFCCNQCDFHLHPKCALKKMKMVTLKRKRMDGSAMRMFATKLNKSSPQNMSGLYFFGTCFIIVNNKDRQGARFMPCVRACIRPTEVWLCDV